MYYLEPNDKVEVHVDLVHAEITVDTYMTANHMVGYPESEIYFSLHGCMGYPSIEDKFNEVISNLS